VHFNRSSHSCPQASRSADQKRLWKHAAAASGWRRHDRIPP